MSRYLALSNLLLVPRLRMRGAIRLLPQYVFLVKCLINQWTHLHGVALRYAQS